MSTFRNSFEGAKGKEIKAGTERGRKGGKERKKEKKRKKKKKEWAEAEVCQRRRLLIPVNGADPTEINTLLEASHTERHAKEIIQDQLVGSKKFFYEEGDAGSAASCM
ncbi:PREDICTED: tumor necrosis factor receptor superfamily member 10D-like [Colobus angolensis palliatus]|uniref:tumor necrosis factor receptor superfamily member 10D-like n=1 Tax=Colobus angolensis palliatus TaxID=336983 RepID=UPI0005F467A2|nr:PREDICTED: tumor necrosis factor receptor superfamily member 10D-like [Colobus angolensis palliatus]